MVFLTIIIQEKIVKNVTPSNISSSILVNAVVLKSSTALFLRAIYVAYV